jgi:hypothetical protein
MVVCFAKTKYLLVELEELMEQSVAPDNNQGNDFEQR